MDNTATAFGFYAIFEMIRQMEKNKENLTGISLEIAKMHLSCTG